MSYKAALHQQISPITANRHSVRDEWISVLHLKSWPVKTDTCHHTVQVHHMHGM